MYQLTGHLGNVLAVVSDKKQYNSTTAYTADLIQADDYYPFGMTIPDRHYSSGEEYRFGFNGMEKDDEVKGNGNSLDFGARIYDSRIGRFNSLDKFEHRFPYKSAYTFASNSPIQAIDIRGDSTYLVIYDRGDPALSKAAKTRQGEIQQLSNFDHDRDIVLMFQIGDLADLDKKISHANFLSETLDTGPTISVDFFTHSGGDGPTGQTMTGGDENHEKNLYSQTGDFRDRKQMTLDGWKDVDFKLAENSLVTFHGCRIGSFLKNFKKLHNPKYVAGHGGASSGSLSRDKYIPEWHSSFKLGIQDVWMIEILDHDVIIPMDIFGPSGKEVNDHNIVTNPYLEDGKIKGYENDSFEESENN